MMLKNLTSSMFVLGWIISAWSVRAYSEESPSIPDTETQNLAPITPAPVNKAQEITEPKPGVSTLVEKEENSKIYSCAVYFPLDSVQFEPQRVDECFVNINLSRVSYVHVIATATLSGTMEHNLYLSTRRAGALEGYLKVKYPQLQVHAFGGGVNPKFGKSARIIIVESSKDPDKDKAGLTPATIQQPQVRVEIQKEYIHPKKNDVNIQWYSGVSQFRPNPSSYQYFGLGVSKNLVAPTIGRFAAGMQYQIFRSNQVYDIHSGTLFGEKMMQIYRISGRSRIDAGTQLLVGIDRVSQSNHLTQGIKALARYVDGDTTGSLELGLSNHFEWAGIAIGVLI